MAGTPKNTELFGIFLLFLLLSGRSGGLGSLSALGQSLRLEHFARDMHRIVDMMDQMSSFGQMASLPQQLPYEDNSRTSELNLPDMGQLMEMAGPLMAMLGGQNRDYR